MAAQDSIRAVVKGVDATVARFEGLPEQVKLVLGRTIREWIAVVHQHAIARASGEYLQVRTGRFVKSIKERFSERGKYTVRGSVYSSDPSAGVLEFGGTLKPRVIVPRNAHALHFLKSGADVFADVVHHPGMKIGPHPILLGAMEELRPQIEKALVDSVDQEQGE